MSLYTLYTVGTVAPQERSGKHVSIHQELAASLLDFVGVRACVRACALVLSLHHATQIPYEQTKAINQWRSIGKSPFSDECLVQLTSEERYDDSGNLLIEDETRGVYLDCTYEEDIAMASAQTRFAETLLRVERMRGRACMLPLPSALNLVYAPAGTHQAVPRCCYDSLFVPTLSIR